MQQFNPSSEVEYLKTANLGVVDIAQKYTANQIIALLTYLNRQPSANLPATLANEIQIISQKGCCGDK